MEKKVVCLACFALLSISIFSQKAEKLTEDDLKIWWQKDLQQDSIPGIGLDRAYNKLLKNREGHEVIVAVLDTKIDIEHEDLKEQVWKNTDEIPGNNIDDDKNGYIDDINGWNFLGNPEGGEAPYQSYEIVRVIKGYENSYLGKEFTSKAAKDIEERYKKAKAELKEERENIVESNRYIDSLANIYFDYKKDILKLLDGNEFNTKAIDSLIMNDLVYESQANWMKEMIEWGIEEESFQAYTRDSNNLLDTALSMDFDERATVDGGNAHVRDNDMPYQHATPVSGVLAATRKNGIGISGFSDNIKIMPVVMVSYGDEHDEDVAKAIRYAVDNGAQIINMSWGKFYSTQKELVKEALIYASNKDVLLITGSGNDAKNIDIERNFPTDFYEGHEAFETFINTGGTTNKIDSSLVAKFSNYGKVQVDLFAPANNIYSCDPENTYSSTRGTSFASPMVAGTAALLKSYFPKMTSTELKEIILKSSNKINLMVRRPGDEKGTPLVPFSSLSKTGGILDVYSAVKLAIEMSEQ